MGLATLFAAQSFIKQDGSQKWIRRFFIANGLLVPVLAVVYYYPVYSIALVLLATPWIATGLGSLLLLAVFFLRKSPSSQSTI